MMATLALIAAATAVIASPAAPEVIMLNADRWCPYNCDPASDHPGYMIEVVKAIFEPEYKIEFAEMNWARALEETRKNRSQAVLAAAKSDAPDLIYPELHFGVSTFCFYTRKGDSWAFSGYPSLEGIKLAIINSYSYGEGLDSYLKRYGNDPTHVDMVAGNDALTVNLKKMQRDRVRVDVDDEYVVRYVLSKEPALAIDVRKAGCDTSDLIFVGFTSKHPKAALWAKQFTDGLRQLRQSGRLKTILAGYGLTDWEAP